LDEHDAVQVRPMELMPNQVVLITSGAFTPQQAVVLDASKREVKVAILSLGQELIATIDKTKLVRLEDVF